MSKDERESTTIELHPDDCALVLKANGKKEMYLVKQEDDDEPVADNVMLMVALAGATTDEETMLKVWENFNKGLEAVKEKEDGSPEESESTDGTGEDEDRTNGESA